MKFYPVLFALILSTQASAAGITLQCSSSEAGDDITLTGVGTRQIVIDFGKNDTYEMTRTRTGDCKGRTFFVCYQEGQLLVNIPKSLSSGRKTEGRVWVNIDADDDTSNGRLGIDYQCKAR